MFSLIKYLNTCMLKILVVLLISNFAQGTFRNLSYSYNPGCDIPQCEPSIENVTYLNLVHIAAEGADDTLHFLWSTYEVPSVVVVKTSKEATLKVNWTELYELKEGSVSFHPPPIQSVGLIITELWKFNDSKDTADIKDGTNIQAVNLKSLLWKDVNATVSLSEKLVTVLPVASNNDSIFLGNGKFKLKFSVSGENIASDDYPHLLFTGNSSQLTILLDDLLPDYKSMRFAVELMLVSSFAQDDKWTRDSRKSIDDEYSPGVFEVITLTPLCPNNITDCKSFMAWKPVSYIGTKATVANSSDTSMTDYGKTTAIPPSIATAFFNYTVSSQIAWNVTFGTSDDGFYTKTRYTSWAVMLGVGESSIETMSLVGILVISIGLGTPLVIMLVGAVFLIYNKCRKKDDDLLLSQNSIN